MSRMGIVEKVFIVCMLAILIALPIAYATITFQYIESTWNMIFWFVTTGCFAAMSTLLGRLLIPRRDFHQHPPNDPRGRKKVREVRGLFH
jgi:hypothetical protein